MPSLHMEEYRRLLADYILSIIFAGVTKMKRHPKKHAFSSLAQADEDVISCTRSVDPSHVSTSIEVSKLSILLKEYPSRSSLSAWGYARIGRLFSQATAVSRAEGARMIPTARWFNAKTALNPSPSRCSCHSSGLPPFRTGNPRDTAAPMAGVRRWASRT